MINKVFQFFLKKESINNVVKEGERYDGLPDSLSFEQLTAISTKVFGEPILSTNYLHLSGWKSAGAFRVFITTDKHEIKSLIYKNAVYGNEHTPALEGLPLKPGYPEYLICQYADSEFKEYLPEIYGSFEVIPQKNYHYFFEDLSNDFERIQSREDFLTAAAELPKLQTALLKCEGIPFKNEALCFDNTFFVSLEKYCKINLERYNSSTQDRTAKRVLKELPQILRLLKSAVPRNENSLVPIHGDYNPANILISKSNSKRLKFIDWEWMGLGVKHADLASLLKPVSSDTEKEALKLFAQNDKTLSILEHTKFYNLAKIERGIFDAAFFAKHYLNTKSETNINIHEHIQGALKRVLNGYKKIK